MALFSTRGFTRNRLSSSFAFSIILILTLFFGLNPKNYDFENNIQWLSDTAGIEFERYGIAWSEPFIAPQRDTGFSMEVVLKTRSIDKNGFSHIVTLHSGQDGSQVVLGQWGHHIIFMKGNDYEHTKGLPRIAMDVSSLIEREIVFSFISNGETTKAFINGKLCKALKNAALSLPEGVSRIVLGNSIYGKHPWEGELFALALYGTALSENMAFSTYESWLKDRKLLFDSRKLVWAAYDFKDKGAGIIDVSGGNHDFMIPAKMQTLKKRYLKAENKFSNFDAGTAADIVVNLCGFVPFGFSMFLLRSTKDRYAAVRYLLLVVFSGFLLSLFIETVQVWMPSRSSDAYDLGLNTVGTILGAWVGMKTTESRAEAQRRRGKMG